MVSSFFPGRVRLRAPIFKDAEIVQVAQEMIQAVPAVKAAVKSIEHNLMTGSVLIHYDTGKIPIEKIRPLLPLLHKLHGEVKRYTPADKGRILAMLRELQQLAQQW